MMSAMVPSVEVRAPDGRESVVDLRGERLSVGRGAPGNEPDLALGPDPQRWVSRLHCMLELDAGAWWLSDNGTRNGTLVRRGEEEPGRVQGRVRLDDGDVILILGAMTEEGEPLYWRLAFSDPHATRRPEQVEAGRAGSVAKICLEYDWVQAKVYRRQEGAERTEVVGMRPKAHQLVRYMADKSRKNGGVPVACEHEELIRALCMTLHDAGRHEEALACFDQVLEIEPRYSEGWNAKGLTLCALDRYEEALGCYEQALKIDPRNSNALERKREVLRVLRRKHLFVGWWWRRWRRG